MSEPTQEEANRIRLVASLTLATVMGAHVMLETGVDALFLANIPVERLPLVTIALAIVALGASRFGGDREHRTVLVALQAAAALGTLVFYLLQASPAAWVYYGLYAWSGIATSLVVVRFWLLIGDLFTIVEGKRFFASIALGGSSGALIGSGFSVLIAPNFGGPGLLVAAAVTYALSAGIAWTGLPTEDPRAVAEPKIRPRPSFLDSLRTLVEHPYASRVAALIAIASLTLTLGDYLFKSVLAAEIDPQALATWLSRIYLALNVLSIAVLAFGVTPLVRSLGVDRSQAVLPLLIAAAAAGVLAGAALVATVALKVADGMLRYSLHKTATELLYLPMTSDVRTAIKSAVDLVGQSAAKAVASVLILGLVLTPEPRLAIAGTLCVAAAVWLVMALRLRRSYLDVFRDTLGQRVIATMLDYPELDLDSVGSLVRALSDPDENRAVAALELLAERDQLGLVPSLILYHPAPRVVADALDRFAAARRDDIAHLIDHLVEHEDPAVRAASVRARWILGDASTDLRPYEDSSCLVVRISAAAGLFHRSELSGKAFLDIVEEAMVYEDASPRLAFLRASQLRYDTIHRAGLIRLLRDEDPHVAQEAVRAIRMSKDDWFVPQLTAALDRRATREPIRHALLAHPTQALAHLSERLVAPDTLPSLRTHLPRTIARFESAQAARVLLASFGPLDDGLVRFKVLKGLEYLFRTAAREPRRRVDAEDVRHVDLTPLGVEFDHTLEEALETLALGRRLSRIDADGDRGTVGRELLLDLLREKTELATGRLFLMLGLLHRGEDFRSIRMGLRSASTKDRASAVELIESLLSQETAIALLDLTSGGFASAEQQGRRSSRRRQEEEARVLEDVVALGSETLSAIVLYHAGELGLSIRAEALPEEDPKREGGLAAIRALFTGGRRVPAAERA